MSFWEHVEALRGVLWRAVVVVTVLTVVMAAVMPSLFDAVVLAPCRPDFPLYTLLRDCSAVWGLMPDSSGWDTTVQLVNIELSSQFFIHMSASFWFALVLSVPALLFLVWQFISPALYAGERKGVLRAFTGGALMFFLGVATGYCIVFPLTLRFLAGYQLSALVPNQISLTSYIDTFAMLTLLMGLMFELPVVAWLLGKMGLLTRRLFRRYRRHAVVALLVLSAVITPTADPFTLMVVFIPVYLLWELGALLVPSGDKGADM